jgi:hypothetical protein
MEKEEYTLMTQSNEQDLVDRHSEIQEQESSFKDIHGHTSDSKKSHIIFKAVNVFKSFVGCSILTLAYNNSRV